MSLLVYTASTPGAPTLNAVNGSFCNVLDVALVAAGWTILFTSGNARVYRSVNGRLLHVYHDSTVSGSAQLVLVRGCEAASSATSITDPYPTVAQVANNASNWSVGPSGATARDYRLYISDDFFSFVLPSASTVIPYLVDTWTGNWFGQPQTPYAAMYSCMIRVRNVTSTTAGTGAITNATVNSVPTSDGNCFWMRSVDGSVKSSRGCLSASGISVGSVATATPPLGGYQNRIYREPIGVSDIGSSTTTPSAMALKNRGFLPQLWGAIHNNSGALTADESFQDTAYNPSAVFRPFAAQPNNSWIIIEETDTWVPY